MGGDYVEVRWRFGMLFGMRLTRDFLMVIWKAIWMETLEGLLTVIWMVDLDGCGEVGGLMVGELPC
jgi:hypothetical protein